MIVNVLNNLLCDIYDGIEDVVELIPITYNSVLFFRLIGKGFSLSLGQLLKIQMLIMFTNLWINTFFCGSNLTILVFGAHRYSFSFHDSVFNIFCL